MGNYQTHGLTGAAPADLDWLAGSWLGHNGSDSVEEHWSPAAGGSLLGMFRWVRGGTVRFYELIAIEQDGDFVRMRIRHFDPGLVLWDVDKDNAHEFLLVKLHGAEAVFLEVNRPDARFVVYRREGHDRLLSYFADETGQMLEPGLFEYAQLGHFSQSCSGALPSPLAGEGSER
jgi:hypothetical protein